MTTEHIGGKNGLAHIELWGFKSDIATLESDENKMRDLLSYNGEVVFFTMNEAIVYYLDKTSETFKPLGE